MGQRLTGMTSGQKSFPVAPTIFKYSQHGKGGTWMSELLPNLATVADDIALVHSLHSEEINHAPAQIFMNPAYMNVSLKQQPMFTVSVMIRSAGGIGSVPFHLAFDPLALEFLNYSRSSPFLSQDGATPFVLATLGSGNNEVIVGLSRDGSRPGVSGQGPLIDLTFRARKAGTTTLNFSDISVLDTSAQRLPFDRQGMTINVQ